MPELSLDARPTRQALPQRLQTLVSELERRGGALDLATATRLLGELPLAAEDVRGFVSASERGYVRRRVARTEAFEVLVMTWSPTQTSGPHDHGGSRCALRIVSGCIQEAHFERGKDGLVTPRARQTHCAGQVLSAASAGIHALSAPDDALEPTVTLHVYVPPLPEMRRYAARKHGEAPLRAFTPQRDQAKTVIGVVGGGFSGTMVAAHLLAKGSGRGASLSLVMFERQTAFGEGAAYRTADYAHLLNVPAGRMSAWPEKPSHFLDWAKAQDATVSARDFLPRRRYAEYLRESLFEVARDASEQVSLAIEHDEVAEIEDTGAGYRLRTAQGRALRCDAVVLASGHRPPRDPFQGRWRGPRTRYIAEPWGTLALSSIAPDEPVLIVGTGLSAVDTLLSLQREPRRAPVTMVSLHGRLPAPHADEPVAPRDAAAWLGPMLGHATVRTLLAGLRAEVARAAHEGGDWRAVIDGLRPHTETLWRALPEQEARRFLRHLRSLWDVHRHRMAPQVATQIADWRAQGFLDVQAGRVAGAAADARGIRVELSGRGPRRSLETAWVVNCTGPSPGVDDDPRPVVRKLVADGLLTPDPLGLGVLTGPRGEALDRGGRLRSDLVVVGPLRAAQLWESTAVPELRVQARDAAGALLAD